jgi:adenylyl- and sulfurtransferase ThiI
MAKQPNKKRPNKKSTKQQSEEYNDWKNFRIRMKRRQKKESKSSNVEQGVPILKNLGPALSSLPLNAQQSSKNELSRKKVSKT